MIVRVNGEEKELPERATVLDLLEVTGLAGSPVVVQRNDDILDQESFGKTPLNHGDQVELVRLVGGG